MSQQEGVSRFAKEAAIGGTVGGVLSSVPCLAVFNCCCCAIDLFGAGLGVYLWVKAHPDDELSTADAALMGAISGAVTGVILSLLGLLQKLAFSSQLDAEQVRELLDNPMLPPELRRAFDPKLVEQLLGAANSPLLDLAGIPMNMALYGGFGILGAMATLHLLFADRVAR